MEQYTDITQPLSIEEAIHIVLDTVEKWDNTGGISLGNRNEPNTPIQRAKSLLGDRLTVDIVKGYLLHKPKI